MECLQYQNNNKRKFETNLSNQAGIYSSLSNSNLINSYQTQNIIFQGFVTPDKMQQLYLYQYFQQKSVSQISSLLDKINSQNIENSIKDNSKSNCDKDFSSLSKNDELENTNFTNQICKNCGQNFSSILHICNQNKINDYQISFNNNVDIDSEFENINENKKFKPIIKSLHSTLLICDTNILIQDLDSAMLLKCQPHIQLIIPFICVQELDGLKKNPELKNKAQSCLSFILQEMNSEQTNENQIIKSWIRPQSQEEYSKNVCLKNNDDKILSLAVYLKEFHQTKKRIILLTSDIGLKLKCKYFNIETFTLKEFQIQCPTIEQIKTVFKPKINQIQINHFPNPESYNKLISLIFNYLDPKDLLICLGVCKTWNSVLTMENNSTEMIWKNSLLKLFKKDFLETYIKSENHSKYRKWYSNWRKSIMPIKSSFKKMQNNNLEIMYQYYE